jgi:hypothetical protein
MRGINDQLASWATSELKYWEQVALDKVSRQSELTAEDLQGLVQSFLEDAGLAPVPTVRPQLAITAASDREPEAVPCRLTRLFDLRNVNALPSGQEIRFGPQLTLVYGNNGVGKSGYARALASAGFCARQARSLDERSRNGIEGAAASKHRDIVLKHAKSDHVDRGKALP